MAKWCSTERAFCGTIFMSFTVSLLIAVTLWQSTQQLNFYSLQLHVQAQTSVHSLGKHKAAKQKVSASLSDMLDQEPSQPITKYNELHPYLIVLGYGDQLGGAMRSLVQLLNITVHWNKRPVEPFVNGSRYIAVPSTTDLQTVYRFGNFYDRSAVEVQLGDCFSHNVSFSSFEDFLLSSTRNFILLQFSRGNDVHPGISNCTNVKGKKIKKIEQKLNTHFKNAELKSKAIAKHGANYTFRADKAICVDGSQFSMQEVKRAVIGDRPGSEQLTVVMPTWRYVKNVSNKYYYYDPSSRDPTDSCGVDNLPHASLVLQSAEEFQKSLGLPIRFLGIHIRIEWLVIANNKRPGYMEKCLSTTQAIVKGLMKKYDITSKSIVAINDYSNYGSASLDCARSINCVQDQLRKQIVDRLETWGVRTIAYDPSSFEKPLHRGFVSLVEKEFLSNANYLLVVGGGVYQASIRSMFAEKHGTGQLYTLCRHGYSDTWRYNVILSRGT